MLTQEKPYLLERGNSLFEQAEHWLDVLFHPHAAMRETSYDNLVDVHEAACKVSVRTLDRAWALATLQRQSRLGMLMQPELVRAINALSQAARTKATA